MAGRDGFSGYHPGVNFLYFTLVLGFTMFVTHPAGVAVSLVSALCYQRYLNGPGAAARQLRWLGPMLVMAAALNGLLNHRGETALFRLPGGGAVTLESLLCGVGMAGMLWAVTAWFGCFNRVVTSDKFLYLFGRAIPALSLVLSMALGFVPKLKERFGRVVQAQAGLGRSVTGGGVSRRVKNAVGALSILTTWTLESAVATADSMRSRGYGLPGRTAFSIYRFHTRDKLCAAWLLALGGFLLWAGAKGALAWQYFPRTEGAAGPLTLWAWAGYLALCLTPVILDRKEDAQWRRLRSAV